MQNRKPIVGITQGDGNGIGYEVIIKAAETGKSSGSEKRNPISR